MIIIFLVICVFWLGGIICLYSEFADEIKTKKDFIYSIIIPLYAIYIVCNKFEDIIDWWKTLK
jgi:hypothetical protein